MRTLLLADDNVTVQRVIALTFAQEQVRVVTASDGNQAMDRMVMERPDIVLAGTTLPQVNGYDLSRFVKSRPELKGVPVLLLSGAFEMVDEARLASSGANGVIEKPVEPTEVISRVKELLGLQTDGRPPQPAGRPVTPATASRERPAMPTTPRAVTSTRPKPPAWDQLNDQATDPKPRPAEAALPGDDYLDSLGDALDTLDQQLAGRNVTSRPGASQPRNPAPPLGQPSDTVDPRSPGRKPATQGATESGPNPVYEVDDAWFDGENQAREVARSKQREMVEDLRAPELQPAAPVQAAPPPPSAPVYEIDDEWFAEDRKARAAREVEQRELAREMGIHEVELPDTTPAVPVVSKDFEFGEADLTAAIATPAAPAAESPASAVAPAPPEELRPIERIEPIELPREELAPPVPAIVEVALAPAMPANPEPIVEVQLSREREEVLAMEPIARALPMDFFAASAPKRPPQTPPQGPPVAAVPDVGGIAQPIGPVVDEPRRDTRQIADDFEALLAFEQGKQSSPPMNEPIIHAVTPEITGEMLEQIAATVADRLTNNIRVEPVAPPLTDPMLDRIAASVSERLHGSIRIEPAVPEITPSMLEQIATTVSDRLADRIKVEPAAPEITGEMLDRISASVSERLQHTIKIEAVAPELSPPMLDHVSATVAGHLKDSIRIEPVTPEITEPMLEQIGSVVADRLRGSIRVEAKAPDISENMLGYMGTVVAERLAGSIKVEPAPPQLTEHMLGHMAWQVSEHLSRGIRVEPAVAEITEPMLQQIAALVAERLKDSIRVEPVAPQVSSEVAGEVASQLADRLKDSVHVQPVAPQITGEMLDQIAARVSDRLQPALLADQLQEAVALAITNTVRSVVSDASERLVRDEIERIKSKP